VVGSVGTEDVVAAYRKALSSTFESLRSIFPRSILAVDQVGPESPVSGRTVSEAGLPRGTVVVAIQRGEQLIFPEPSTQIRSGDIVNALVPSRAEQDLRHAIVGTGRSDDDADDAALI
jgi:Trk K+ transport system NAD-binding subunit